VHVHEDGGRWRMDASSRSGRYICRSKKEVGANACVRRNLVIDLADRCVIRRVLDEAADLPGTIEDLNRQAEMSLQALKVEARGATRALDDAERRVTVGLRKLMDGKLTDEDYASLKFDVEVAADRVNVIYAREDAIRSSMASD